MIWFAMTAVVAFIAGMAFGRFRGWSDCDKDWLEMFRFYKFGDWQQGSTGGRYWKWTVEPVKTSAPEANGRSVAS